MRTFFLKRVAPIVFLFLLISGRGGLGELAQARRFDMKTENFATYFGGSFGPSNLSDGAFSLSGGTDVTTDKIVRSNYSGEIGFTLTSNSGGLRFVGEYLLGQTLTGVSGTHSSGVKYYDLTSKVSAFVPMVLAEAPVWKGLESRVMIGGGLGYAFVSLDQEYTMTAAGATALGVGDYIEKASTQALAWRVYTSFETLFVDTTTVSFELGYKSVKVGSLQSLKDTAAISGNQTKGSDLRNMDASNRAFDLGGAYVGVLFRFYL